MGFIKLPHFKLPNFKGIGNNLKFPKLPFNIHPEKIFNRVKDGFKEAFEAIGKGASTVSDKLKIVEDLLDKKTSGIAGTVVNLALPEVALAQATSKILSDVSQGKSLESSLKTVATTLIYNYAIKSESDLMKLGASAFQDPQVQSMVANSQLGRMAIDAIKNALPADIRPN